MHTGLKILFSVSLTLFVGCASEEQFPAEFSPIVINKEIQEQIKSTKVVVSINQDKRLGIPISGHGTSHQYFGVIGKLADSARIRFDKDLSEEQHKLLLRVDMAAYKFDTGVKFREAVNSNLDSLGWLNISSVVNQTDVQASDVERMVKTQDEDTLLLIDNRYLMAIDFSSITVFSYVTLYAHEESLVKIAKTAMPYEDPPTLHKKLFSFVFPYEGNYTTAKDALTGWEKNEGEMVKRAITESITDLTNRIVADLSSTASNQ